MGEKYNGWDNYETWLVALWIDNEPGSYDYRQELAQSAYDDAEPDSYFTREERATLDLAESLKDWIENDNPLADSASLYSDLISGALGSVNWHEIAENYLEDVDKDTELEQEEPEND